MSAELATTQIVSNANLKAYYRFESGALTTDTSGEGHTLTAISDPAEDASGKFGGAVALDGNDAYSATDHADFKPTGNFTVGAWVKSSSPDFWFFQSYAAASSKMGGIVMYCASTTGNFGFLSGKNTGNVADTDYKSVDSGVSITDGNWHFVIATWDGAKIHLYIDGAESGTGTDWANAPAYQATNYVIIGGRDRTGTIDKFLTGSLDDVFLLNGTALSTEQIASIWSGMANVKINIGDVWKDAIGMQINIGDAWKTITNTSINIGDAWKTIF